VNFEDIREGDWLVCVRSLGFTNAGDISKVTQVWDSPASFALQKEDTVYTRSGDCAVHYELAPSLLKELL
jgi:hypothetical protein